MTTERLKVVFAEALGLPAEKITDDLAYNSIKEWDSTAHMILVAALEDTFDVMLDTDDIIDMSSVAKAREILKKYDIEC
ncbi:acyl carrier protein [Aliidiomarina celeris]|uniref:acyl carrier protein n=1 Tax=Aliidiomarina celeris TaxID=2249428 RepID=UPI000DE934E3|nr:acyl carrier protein [Aliidiomarina celeris]